MKRFYILIIALNIFITSCDDYVDIAPKGSAIAENLKDIDYLLNQGQLFSGFKGNKNVIPALLNDNIFIPEEDLALIKADQYERSVEKIYSLADVFYTSSEEDKTWDSQYKAIANENYILDVLKTIEGDINIKNKYEGEVLTHRAFSYFRLVNFYGVHYGLPQASEKESGVSILLNYANSEESLVRRSVNDVYEQIEKDLLRAISLLPEKRPTPYRVNKPAAKALLARVYLHMGNYTDALKYANDALAFNSELIDYNELDGFPPRAIKNKENILVKDGSVELTSVEGDKTLGFYSDGLINAYDDKLNDLRISKIPGKDQHGRYMYGLNDVWEAYFSLGVTVPELMLIKAECLAQSENTYTEAVDVLNYLRSYRFDSTAVNEGKHLLSAGDKDEALALINAERRREFHITGMRFFDIKRLNALYNAGISLVRGNVEWSPNSINWAVPIGLAVIENGENAIKQNLRE